MTKFNVIEPIRNL